MVFGGRVGCLKGVNVVVENEEELGGGGGGWVGDIYREMGIRGSRYGIKELKTIVGDRQRNMMRIGRS
jgi:hypothetical protein